MIRHAVAEVGRVLRADTKVHGRFRRHVSTLLVLTLGIDLICAVVAYAVEHGHKSSEIESFGSAIFWTTTQLLTVSSQMHNPVTTAGRVLDVFMEIWALTLITSMAGSVGTFLMKKGEGKPV